MRRIMMFKMEGKTSETLPFTSDNILVEFWYHVLGVDRNYRIRPESDETEKEFDYWVVVDWVTG
jgi:hypothetical protein